MPYDPTLYAGAASHYLRGRPPYSADLLDVLTTELGLDGTGRLLDVGCGPGVLAVQLAPAFEEVRGLDPDPGMIAEATRHGVSSGENRIIWIEARAEDIGSLGLPPMRLVTFGQSFHWTERDVVADAVFGLLVPGGSIAMITHDVEVRPKPADGPAPLIPHDAIHDVLDRFVGPHRRPGRDEPRHEPFGVTLARAGFTEVRELHAPGRAGLVRSDDEVVSMFLSMSFATPHRLGDRLQGFVDATHDVLREVNPDRRFWDWPGDIAILVATKR